MFFLLGGFLMCFSVELRNGKIGKYYKKRLIRILPFYYITLAVYICFSLAGIMQAPLDETGLYWQIFSPFKYIYPQQRSFLDKFRRNMDNKLFYIVLPACSIPV